MFLDSEKDLGQIKSGVKQTVTFRYSNIKQIFSISGTCDCVTGSDSNSTNNEGNVTVFYTPRPVPEHLKQMGKGSYTATKTLDVLFTPADQPFIQVSATLIIKATVHDS